VNTPREWKTMAKVHNPERKAFWESIFNGDTVPVISFVPEWANLPGYDEPQPVYMLDLKAITAEQRKRLIKALARRFGIPEETVAQKLEEHGVPILASDVTVISKDRALVMSAIL